MKVVVMMEMMKEERSREEPNGAYKTLWIRSSWEGRSTVRKEGREGSQVIFIRVCLTREKI